MKKVLFILVCLVASPAQALVIDFDDISTAANDDIPSEYKGLNWDGNWAINSASDYMSSYYNTYTPVSGEYAAYNSNGVLSVSLSSGEDFDFIGAYFTAWAAFDDYYLYSATSITIEGYDDGLLSHSISMDLSADQYDWLQADFSSIDNLRFISSDTSKWWLMDDLTIELASVPIPHSLALVGIGMLGMGLLTRRAAGA